MARALFTSEGAPCLKCHMTGDPKHDAHATAPNFMVARERLKPGWTKRWMLRSGHDESGDGDAVGAVPAGGRPLGVRRSGARQFQRLSRRTTRELLVRYMFQFTPEELARLRASAAEPVKWTSGKTIQLEGGSQSMKKIWIGAGWPAC